MPIHDWTRVTAGTWHDFHLAWIATLRNTLNEGLLPPDHYAQAEQIAGPYGPDVFTLQEVEADSAALETVEENGEGSTLVMAPPQTRISAEVEMNDYVQKRRTLVIRHVSGDRHMALIELISTGNKGTGVAFRSFVDKAVAALCQGYHLLIVDLFPPGPRDPKGIHAAIWGELTDDVPSMPAEEPLTLAAYSAGPVKRAFVEPTAVGRPLIDMPLFLTPEAYVNVPLEATYQSAYRGVPRRWRSVLEGKDPAGGGR